MSCWRRNLRFSYTFCLGGLAFSAFLIMLVSGMLLLVYYQPTPERAFNSILFLESSVWGGKYLRSLHRLTSHALLILLILLHTLRVILTGAYQRPRQLNWVIGCLLLFLALFEAYTGYLLPLDQLAFWATQTGMELLATLPFGTLPPFPAGAGRRRPGAVAAPLLCPAYRDHSAVGAAAVVAAFLPGQKKQGGAAVPMKNGFVKSSPHFFRLISRSM